jgi:hypothetical protein
MVVFLPAVHLSETLFLPLFPALLDFPAAIAQLVVAHAVPVKAGADVLYRRFRDIVQRLFRQEGLV